MPPSCTTRTGPRSIRRRTDTTSRSTSRHPTTNRPSRISCRWGARKDDRGSGDRDDRDVLDDQDVQDVLDGRDGLDAHDRGAYERRGRQDHEGREAEHREGELQAREGRRGAGSRWETQDHAERRGAMEESDRRWADNRASAAHAWGSAFARELRDLLRACAYETSTCESRAFLQKVRGRPSSGWTCVPRDRHPCGRPRDRLGRNRRVLEKMRSRCSSISPFRKPVTACVRATASATNGTERPWRRHPPCVFCARDTRCRRFRPRQRWHRG